MTTTDDSLYDPAGPYRVVSANVTAVLAGHGLNDPRAVADVLEAVGTHGHNLATFRLLSPILRTYAAGLIEQAHRLRAEAIRQEARR